MAKICPAPRHLQVLRLAEAQQDNLKVVQQAWTAQYPRYFRLLWGHVYDAPLAPGYSMKRLERKNKTELIKLTTVGV